MNPLPPPPFDTTELEKKKAMLAEVERRFNSFYEKYDAERQQRFDAKMEAQKELSSIQAEIKNLPDKLKAVEIMRNQKCPTCHRDWVAFEDQLKIAEAEIQILTAKAAKISELEARIKSLSKILPEPPEKAKWEGMIAVLGKEIAVIENQKINHVKDHANQEAMRVAAARAQSLEEERIATSKLQMIVDGYRAALDEATKALLKCDHQLELYEQQLNDARAFNNRATQANFRRQQVMDDLASAWHKASIELDQNKVSKAAEQDLSLLLKGFMTAIFDEVLGEIAWNTNSMLARIPNVAHISMGFRSETTTNKGTIKRAITPYLNIGGSERPLKAALSGGMLAAVELAVDLSVRKVISARTGVTPGWLVLDESFEGLGIVEKEAVMQLLSQVASDTLILVVDHSTEFKESFTQVIEVEYRNGRSKIAGM
jgi:ABC-type lipoprotein export system ATPase subunit